MAAVVLVVGRWLLAVGYWLLVSGNWPQIIRCSLFIGN
jgi:hypothetical protein